MQKQPQLAEVRQRLGPQGLKQLPKQPLLTAYDVDNLLNHYFKYPDKAGSTDDNLYLEYSTPKGNVNYSQLSDDYNFKHLQAFQHGQGI